MTHFANTVTHVVMDCARNNRIVGKAENLPDALKVRNRLIGGSAANRYRYTIRPRGGSR